MKKSTHRVEVIRLNRETHPNADALFIQRINGYQAVGNIQDWEGKELAAYILPDSVVDTTRQEFSWLSPTVNPNFSAAVEGSTRYHRVRAMRLRSVISYGLMVEAPEGSKEGDDVSDILEVTRFQPLIITEGQVEAPPGYVKDYDLEDGVRYCNTMFQEGEMVHVIEKLDGVNSRYRGVDGQLHVGSRNIWLGENPESPWWKIVNKYEQLKTLALQGRFTPYGEIVGYVKNLKSKRRYGLPEGEIDFYLFDLLHGTDFANYNVIEEVADLHKLKTPPLVATIPYNFASVKALANGPSLVPGAKHNREGVVVRPVVERQTLQGRAVLKIISDKELTG